LARQKALLLWSTDGHGLVVYVDVRSGHGDEAIERCRETQTFMTGFNAEFVVPAAQGAALLLAFCTRGVRRSTNARKVVMSVHSVRVRPLAESDVPNLVSVVRVIGTEFQTEQ
jgi:hypothetical protein